jgi:hypothetical protein
VQNSTLYYYVDSQGAAAGPVSYNDLRTLLKQGAIKPTTQICKAGDSVWAPFLPNPGDPGIPGEASTVSHPSVKLPVWWGLLLGLAVVGDRAVPSNWSHGLRDARSKSQFLFR